MFVDWNLDLTSFCRTVDYHLWTGLSIKSLQSHFYVRTFLQVERKMNTFWAIFVSAILWCSLIGQNHRLWPWPVQPFGTWLWNWIGLKVLENAGFDCGIDCELSGIDWRKKWTWFWTLPSYAPDPAWGSPCLGQVCSQESAARGKCGQWPKQRNNSCSLREQRAQNALSSPDQISNRRPGHHKNVPHKLLH